MAREGEMVRMGMIGVALALLIGLAGCDMPAGATNAAPASPYSSYGGSAMDGSGGGGGGSGM
ncbi:MAG TPA: hypothetical protein VMA37_08955 [Acetobacteraceae bacterium]|nr:hypothetical protein [Acetobacteraceae bacterium]